MLRGPAGRPADRKDSEVLEMLGRHWESAEATIVAKQVRTAKPGYEPEYDYVVEVRPADGAPLRATIHEGFRGPKGGFADPAVGDAVGVLYDAKSQKVRFDNSDPRLNRDALEQPAADAFAAAASAAPGTTAPGLPGGATAVGDAASTPLIEALLSGQGTDALGGLRAMSTTAQPADPGDRLAKLKELRDKGLLSDAEYEAQRQKIIDAI